MTNSRAIIDYALDGDAVNMRDALYQDIQDRVYAHIEAKKQEVAQSFLSQESVEDIEITHEYVEDIDEIAEANTFHAVFKVKHGGQEHRIPTKGVTRPHSVEHIKRHIPGISDAHAKVVSSRISGIMGE